MPSLLFLVLAAILGAARPLQASPDVVVTTKSSPKEAPISPLLLGGQFEYFSAPIKQRMTSAGLLDSWRGAHLRLMRYPGGTVCDHYVWDNPAGSYFDIPGANANSIVSPAQFIQLCRSVGAEPIFQVNMNCKGGNNDNRINPTSTDDINMGAKWAAGWVRQANIVNGWHVKYWELGNEVWIWLHPDEYARAVAAYSDAMRAVDPRIKILACGLGGKVGPFKDSWLNFPNDPNWVARNATSNEPASWNKALFTIAAGKFDYICPHLYLGGKTGESPRDVYLDTTKRIWESEALNGQYDILKSSKTPVKLAITEWACNHNRSVPGTGQVKFPLYYYSLANGLNTAHYFGMIVKGGVADLAVMHSLSDMQTLYFWPTKELAEIPLDHGPALAFELWGQHLGKKRLATTVSGAPTLSIEGQTYPGVFVFGSQDEKNVYLMAVNLDSDASHKFSWRPARTSLASTGEISIVAGPALNSDNWTSWGKPDALLYIDKRSITLSSGAINFELPAHSMAGLTMPKE